MTTQSTQLPLDHPFADRHHRVYVALTNHCNRSCPWCSTYSSPDGNTFITINQFNSALPETGLFELQLEGGEPTVHPLFWQLVDICRQHPRVTRLVLCTNGATLPRRHAALRQWIDKFGPRFTLKMSINHHLLERDPQLIEVACMLRDVFAEKDDERLVIFNVRLRQGYENDDAMVKDLIERANLSAHSNIFYLQRYGLASDEEQWAEPFLAGHNFRMVNPDGTVFGTNLIERSEAMGALP
jgi:organic radical activating enzyme